MINTPHTMELLFQKCEFCSKQRLGRARLSLLLLLHLPLVEDELFTLEDVAVRASALPRAGGDRREKAPRAELLLESRVELRHLGTPRLEGEGMAATNDLRHRSLVRALLLLRQVDAVAGQVPLLEQRSIHLHNAVLDEGLRAHELVVRSVVDDVHDLALARRVLAAPAEVARVQAQRPNLRVPAAAAHQTHALRADLRHGRRAAHLELALLLVNVALSAGGAVLVAAVTPDTHDARLARLFTTT